MSLSKTLPLEWVTLRATTFQKYNPYITVASIKRRVGTVTWSSLNLSLSLLSQPIKTGTKARALRAARWATPITITVARRLRMSLWTWLYSKIKWRLFTRLFINNQILINYLGITKNLEDKIILPPKIKNRSKTLYNWMQRKTGSIWYKASSIKREHRIKLVNKG